MVEFSSKFDLGEHVMIDKDKSIKAVIIGVLIRPKGIEYEVSWFNAGSLQTGWLAEFRLEHFND